MPSDGPEGKKRIVEGSNGSMHQGVHYCTYRTIEQRDSIHTMLGWSTYSMYCTNETTNDLGRSSLDDHSFLNHYTNTHPLRTTTSSLENVHWIYRMVVHVNRVLHDLLLCPMKKRNIEVIARTRPLFGSYFAPLSVPVPP